MNGPDTNRPGVDDISTKIDEQLYQQENDRVTDGNLIISAIDGLLEEVDIVPGFQSRNINGLTLNVNNHSDGSLHLGVKSENEHMASYNKDQWGDEVYELFGHTPVAHSKVELRVIANSGIQRITWYMLRGEIVQDPHRVQVVREALSLSPEPQQ